MKKLLSFILLLSMALLFVCCSGGTSPAEAFLLAARKMEFDTMENLMASETVSLAREMKESYDALTSEEQTVLSSLYSHLQYTMEEESEPKDGVKTVSVHLTMPDISKIIENAEAEILVSGNSADKIIKQMLDSGVIAESCMTERTIHIELKQENDKWLLPYSETANPELLQMLALNDILRFFALN